MSDIIIPKEGKYMSKHSVSDLKQMQSLPLDAKINMTKRRIREWYEYWNGEVYVSVSGGKDSQVLAHIVKQMYPDVKCVYVKTGLEYTSVDKKGNELADVVLRPEMDFLKVITEYGYPVIGKEVAMTIRLAKQGFKSGTNKLKGLDKDGNESSFRQRYKKYEYLMEAPFRISEQCCSVMKKHPCKTYEKQTNQKAITGTMASESMMRQTQWMKTGCNAFDTDRPKSNPLSFWTEQDILAYAKRYEMEFAEIYGKIVYLDQDGMQYDNPLFNESMKLTTTGEKRTGCVFCLFGIVNDPLKILRLKDQEPRMYDYVLRGGKFDDEGMWIPHNGLGYKFVIDWLNEHGNLGIKY